MAALRFRVGGPSQRLVGCPGAAGVPGRDAKAQGGTAMGLQWCIISGVWSAKLLQVAQHATVDTNARAGRPRRQGAAGRHRRTRAPPPPAGAAAGRSPEADAAAATASAALNVRCSRARASQHQAQCVGQGRASRGGWQWHHCVCQPASQPASQGQPTPSTVPGCCALLRACARGRACVVASAHPPVRTARRAAGQDARPEGQEEGQGQGARVCG